MTNSTLPSRIKIGFIDYEILDWNPEVAKAAGYYGMHSAGDGWIKIDLAHPQCHVAETLIHEILHAIFDFAHFDFVTAPSEEFIVSFTASGLTAVLQNNPELMQYLQESLNP